MLVSQPVGIIPQIINMPTTEQAISNIQNFFGYRIKSVWAEMRKAPFRGKSIFVYLETKDLSITPYEVMVASGIPQTKLFINIETTR